MPLSYLATPPPLGLDSCSLFMWLLLTTPRVFHHNLPSDTSYTPRLLLLILLAAPKMHKLLYPSKMKLNKLGKLLGVLRFGISEG